MVIAADVMPSGCSAGYGKIKIMRDIYETAIRSGALKRIPKPPQYCLVDMTCRFVDDDCGVIGGHQTLTYKVENRALPITHTPAGIGQSGKSTSGLIRKYADRGISDFKLPMW